MIVLAEKKKGKNVSTEDMREAHSNGVETQTIPCKRNM